MLTAFNKVCCLSDETGRRHQWRHFGQLLGVQHATSYVFHYIADKQFAKHLQ